MRIDVSLSEIGYWKLSAYKSEWFPWGVLRIELPEATLSIYIHDRNSHRAFVDAIQNILNPEPYVPPARADEEDRS